jgi:multidrug efflux pump subunit AcrA (membrane-fusion protein)
MESPVAASPTAAHLLAHLTLRLARLWLDHAPAAEQSALPPLDLSALAVLPYARTALARHQRLHSVVAVVGWVVDGLTPHLPALEAPLRAAVQAYLDALAKVQADELATDASGYVTERPTTDRGERRLASAVDTDATFRKHDGSPAMLGSNAVISTTATRIRACVALTGSTPDSEAPIVALAQQRDADLALAAADAAIAAAEANVVQAQAALEQAQLSRAYAEIHAPYAGQIAQVNVDPFDASTTVGQGAIRLLDLSTLRVEVPISDVDSAQVQIGQAAQVHADAPDTIYTGRVSYSAPEATVSGSTRTYLVRLDLDQRTDLRPGTQVTVAIATT